MRISYWLGVGDGWFELIHKLCAAIEAEARKFGIDPESAAWPIVIKIKRKHGVLNFTCACGASAHQALNNELMRNIQLDAKDASKHICEECGKPGKLRDDKGWWRVSCDACEEKRKWWWQG